MKKEFGENQKKIALIAHDNKKNELVDWCSKNSDILAKNFLCGTGTTAKLISEKTHLPVRPFLSGPLGGDQQIGARIAEGNVDFLIFFWDPLSSQPHDPDVKALLRIAVLYNIPVAMNTASADSMLK
jgi:methylglyoxal synthase